MRHLCTLLLLGGALTFLGGCYHSFEAPTLNRHYAGTPDTSMRDLSIILVNRTHWQEARQMAAEVEKALERLGGYKVKLIHDTANTFNTSDLNADVIINFTAPVLTFDGKGSNFFVCIPGVLFFAPGTVGYGYDAWMTFNCEAQTPSGETIANLSEPFHLEIRHACPATTFWNYTPFILFNAIARTSYDIKVHKDLYVIAYPPIANQIATHLIQKINAAGWELVDESGYTY